MKTFPCENCIIVPICKQRLHHGLTLMFEKAYYNIFKDYHRAKRQAIIMLCNSCGLIDEFIYHNRQGINVKEEMNHVAIFFKIFDIWKLVQHEKGRMVYYA
jgi:hypothetical protein